MSFLTIEHYSSSFARSRRKILLRRGIFACFVAVIPLFIFAYWLLDAQHFLAQAQSVNEQITYQGKVADGTGVVLPNGQYNFYFELYTVASGGTPVWTEAWTATTTAGQVTVAGGTFTVPLGTSTSLSTVNFATSSLFLQVYFDADGLGGSFEETFTPRKRLTASPYAFNTDKLDGLTASDFISTSTYALPNIGSIGSSSATTTIQGSLAVSESVTIQGVNWATTTIGNTSDYLNIECTPYLGVCLPTLTSYIGGAESVVAAKNAFALLGGAGITNPVFYFGSDDLSSFGTLSYDGATDALTFGSADAFDGGINFGGSNGTTTFDTVIDSNATLYVQGLADSADSLGTDGMILQTNGSVATWVATSSLGLPTGVGVPNMLTAWSSTGSLTATSGPTASYFVATSTTATSTFAGALAVGTTTTDYLVTIDATRDEVSGIHLINQDTGISSAAVIKMNNDVGSSAYYGITGDNFGAYALPNRAVLFSGDGADGIDIATGDSGSDIRFRVNNLDSMTINETGVGIGTTTPGYALDVAGFINTDQYSGYKQDGDTILVTSSTNYGTFVGIGAGAFTLADGFSNTAVGYGALAVATSSDSNTAIGSGALANTTTGDLNVAVGSAAMQSNTTGFRNTAVGTSALVSNTIGQLNTAIGYSALYYNESGSNNVAVGPEALEMNISGTANVAVGAAASNNTSGSGNIAVGQFALYENTTGSNNVAIGSDALRYNQSATSSIAIGQAAGAGTAPYSNQRGIYIGSNAGLNVTTGSDDNILIGYEAGYSNTTGAGNSVLGTSALNMNTTGNYNTAFGYRAALNNTTSNSNTAIGAYSLYTNTTGAGNSVLGAEALFNNISATSTVAIGYRAGYGSAPYSNQSGVYIGYQAGFNAQTGSNDNTFVGYQAGLSNTTGSQNTALGSSVLYSNTTGTGNVALGYYAMNANTTGYLNMAMGNYALQSNTTGQNNVAIGHAALNYNNSATSTVAIGFSAGAGIANYSSQNSVYIGHQAGASADNGSNDNAFVGYQAGLSNTTGSSNSALGSLALYSNTTGLLNSAFGSQALRFNTTGFGNVALGGQALWSNTTGNSSVSVGVDSLFYNASATNTVAIGYSAGMGTAPYSNQYGVYLGYGAGYSAQTGSDENTFIGYHSGYGNTTGSLNTAVGGQALSNNTTGSQNVAVGRFSSVFNTTGGKNSSFGVNSLYSNMTGNDNVALGWSSAYNNNSATNTVNIGSYAGYGFGGAYNNENSVAVGYGAGFNFQTGSDNNTFVGDSAGYDNTTGMGNILFGYHAGDEITTGSNNIVIGYDIDAPDNTGSNQLNIGNLLFGTGIDGTGTTLSSGNIGIGTTTPWRKFSVTGTVAFDGLTSNNGITDDLCIDPVTKEVVQNTGATTCIVSSQKYKHDIYDLTYDNMSALEKINILRPVSYKDNNTDQENLGFIAEEVIKIDPRLVFMEPKDQDDPRGVKYEQLTALLTKGIQELWHNVQELWDKLTAQDIRIKKLEERIEQLEAAQGSNVSSDSGSVPSEPEPNTDSGSTDSPELTAEVIIDLTSGGNDSSTGDQTTDSPADAGPTDTSVSDESTAGSQDSAGGADDNSSGTDSGTAGSSDPASSAPTDGDSTPTSDSNS